MPMKFEPRMGVSWSGRNNRMRYGVIIGCEDDGTVNIVPVRALVPGVHCYDEGLDYKRDHDNVRLDDAPPPFAFLCIRDGTDKCYAMANTSVPIPFYPDELDFLTVTDGGEKISEKDFDTIFNHPWPEQPQKERILERPEPAPVMSDVPRRRSSFAVLLQTVAGRTEEGEEEEKDDGPDFW